MSAVHAGHITAGKAAMAVQEAVHTRQLVDVTVGSDNLQKRGLGRRRHDERHAEEVEEAEGRGASDGLRGKGAGVLCEWHVGI